MLKLTLVLLISIEENTPMFIGEFIHNTNNIAYYVTPLKDCIIEPHRTTNTVSIRCFAFSEFLLKGLMLLFDLQHATQNGRSSLPKSGT
jgi:hypothetical protein